MILLKFVPVLAALCKVILSQTREGSNEPRFESSHHELSSLSNSGEVGSGGADSVGDSKVESKKYNLEKWFDSIFPAVIEKPESVADQNIYVPVKFQKTVKEIRASPSEWEEDRNSRETKPPLIDLQSLIIKYSQISAIFNSSYVNFLKINNEKSNSRYPITKIFLLSEPQVPSQLHAFTDLELTKEITCLFSLLSTFIEGHPKPFHGFLYEVYKSLKKSFVLINLKGRLMQNELDQAYSAALVVVYMMHDFLMDRYLHSINIDTNHATLVAVQNGINKLPETSVDHNLINDKIIHLDDKSNEMVEKTVDNIRKNIVETLDKGVGNLLKTSKDLLHPLDIFFPRQGKETSTPGFVESKEGRLSQRNRLLFDEKSSNPNGIVLIKISINKYLEHAKNQNLAETKVDNSVPEEIKEKNPLEPVTISTQPFEAAKSVKPQTGSQEILPIVNEEKKTSTTEPSQLDNSSKTVPQENNQKEIQQQHNSENLGEKLLKSGVGLVSSGGDPLAASGRVSSLGMSPDSLAEAGFDLGEAALGGFTEVVSSSVKSSVESNLANPLVPETRAGESIPSRSNENRDFNVKSKEKKPREPEELDLNFDELENKEEQPTSETTSQQTHQQQETPSSQHHDQLPQYNQQQNKNIDQHRNISHTNLNSTLQTQLVYHGNFPQHQIHFNPKNLQNQSGNLYAFHNSYLTSQPLSPPLISLPPFMNMLPMASRHPKKIPRNPTTAKLSKKLNVSYNVMQRNQPIINYLLEAHSILPPQAPYIKDYHNSLQQGQLALLNVKDHMTHKNVVGLIHDPVIESPKIIIEYFDLFERLYLPKSVNRNQIHRIIN